MKPIKGKIKCHKKEIKCCCTNSIQFKIGPFILDKSGQCSKFVSSSLSVYSITIRLNSSSLPNVLMNFALCIVTRTRFDYFWLPNFLPRLNGLALSQQKKSVIKLPLNKQKCILFNLMKQSGCTFCNILHSLHSFAPFFRRSGRKISLSFKY